MTRQVSRAVGAMVQRPGRAVLALIAINVGLYVVQLILERLGVPVAGVAFLTPALVFDAGWFWQPITYFLLHAPRNPMHLMMNMLVLWMFGSPLEAVWGSRRLVVAYIVSALSGSVFTLLVALLAQTPILHWLLPAFWESPHVGASGAVMGLTIAWGIVFKNVEMNFLFVGRMKPITFMWILVGFEILVALSFDQTSSTSHFGGMIGGAVLCLGLWRPSRWGELWRRARLKQKQAQIERELRSYEGGVPQKKRDDRPN